MSLTRFFEIIDSSGIGNMVRYRADLIAKTDPERIYVENIRSFFHLPHATARFLCDLAAKEGVFIKKIGFLCPNHQNIMRSFQAGSALPDTVGCQVCEAEGLETEYKTKELEKIVFYSVRNREG